MTPPLALLTIGGLISGCSLAILADGVVSRRRVWLAAAGLLVGITIFAAGTPL